MFGMGTGGSLRLLSPERSGAPAFCCRALLLRQSAVELPPDFPFALRSAFLQLSLLPAFACSFLASHPQNRTGQSARFRLTMTSAFTPRHSLPASPLSLQFSLSGLPFRFPFRLRSQPSSFPNHLLRSSPRPISITKLHTLLHFHR